MRTLVWRNVIAALLVVLALVLAVGWMSMWPTGYWGVENVSCPVPPAIPSTLPQGCQGSPVPTFFPGTPSQQP